MKLGMQIYGLRNELTTDFEGTIAKIAAMALVSLALLCAPNSSTPITSIAAILAIVPSKSVVSSLRSP